MIQGATTRQSLYCPERKSSATSTRPAKTQPGAAQARYIGGLFQTLSALEVF